MTPEKFDKQFNIDARTSSEITKIDVKNKCVFVKNLITGENYTETYDKLILSPGASPIVPNFPGLSLLPYFTLRNVVDVEKIKTQLNNRKHVTIIGGGFIGVEVAENLAEIGIKVTLVEAGNQIMKPFDYEMVKFINSDDIKLSKFNHIIVNKNYQTSNPDIYAVGDAILVENAITNQTMPCH